MNPLVIAVFRKKNPNRSGDEMVWSRDKGFIVPKEELIHGHTLWALSEGREGKARIEMRFCQPLGEIVFPEKFVKKTREYKSWESIKAAIKQFFGGRKPEGMSWNEAKIEMEKAKPAREREDQNRKFPGVGLVRMPSLMEHRAGSRVLRTA